MHQLAQQCVLPTNVLKIVWGGLTVPIFMLLAFSVLINNCCSHERYTIYIHGTAIYREGTPCFCTVVSLSHSMQSKNVLRTLFRVTMSLWQIHDIQHLVFSMQSAWVQPKMSIFKPTGILLAQIPGTFDQHVPAGCENTRQQARAPAGWLFWHRLISLWNVASEWQPSHKVILTTASCPNSVHPI